MFNQFTIDREKTCCFTGHRPPSIGGYNLNNPTANDVRERLRKAIDYALINGYTTFISGMALGVDTIAAEEILSLRNEFSYIKLIAAIPCSGQSRVWNRESASHYDAILASANVIHNCTNQPYTPECMQIRNRWMVDNSSMVIAVWDGKPGGTANCINYAKSRNPRPEILRITPNHF